LSCSSDHHVFLSLFNKNKHFPGIVIPIDILPEVLDRAYNPLYLGTNI
jgi:hypothetical protein